MKTVVIESSTERSLAALFFGDEIIGRAELPVGLTSSKHLLCELQKLLKANGLSPSEIELIISGVGPGSYTGIRVGASIAKTLSFACRIPLVGVCSLEGFRPEGDGAFAAVIDAKISGVFVRFGDKRRSRDLGREAAVLSIEEAAGRLASLEMAVTPFKSVLEQKLVCPAWLEQYPDAGAIYRAGIEKYRAGAFTQDGTLELNYLRDSYLLPQLQG